MYGCKSFNSNLCTEVYDVDPVEEFEWVIPQSGLLHFEMNAGKSFMSLC